MSYVSIIILTYNSEKHIEKVISSIFDRNKDSDFEVIVVDNNSKDGTVKLVQSLKLKVKNYSSEFKVIQNTSNTGFAKGINIGAKEAKGEYLLFINPDAEFVNGNIDRMVEVFKRREKAGIVGGKIIDKNNKEEKSAGKFFGIFESLLIALGLDEMLGVRFSPKKEESVDFVSGAFMMVPKKIFDELSGFDENFFMYVEDMEFCYRAKKEKYLTYFSSVAVLQHESHGSSNRAFAIKNIYKGILYFQKKHGSGISYFLVRFLLLAKARALVMAGEILNNKSLTETYREALKNG